MACYQPVVSYGLIEPYWLTCGVKHWDFLRKSWFFRKRNVSLTKIPAEETAAIAETLQQV